LDRASKSWIVHVLHNPPKRSIDEDRIPKNTFCQDGAGTLGDSDRNLMKCAWILISVFKEQKNRDCFTGFNPVRRIGQELRLILLEETEEVLESVMGFGVCEERKEQPGERNQYVLPFQRTFPPNATRRGSRSTYTVK
jgi:hypothetical protein